MKFSGMHVLFIAQLRILPKPTRKANKHHMAFSNSSGSELLSRSWRVRRLDSLAGDSECARDASLELCLLAEPVLEVAAVDLSLVNECPVAALGVHAACSPSCRNNASRGKRKMRARYARLFWICHVPRVPEPKHVKARHPNSAGN